MKYQFCFRCKHIAADTCHNSVPGACGKLESCYEVQRKVLYKHNRDLAQTQDCLARCWAMLGKGDISIVLCLTPVKFTESMKPCDIKGVTLKNDMCILTWYIGILFIAIIRGTYLLFFLTYSNVLNMLN